MPPVSDLEIRLLHFFSGRNHLISAVTNLPLADISLFGRCEQFGNELLHGRSRILFRILHTSHGIDIIFYETSTKTYFNPPDTHALEN